MQRLLDGFIFGVGFAIAMVVITVIVQWWDVRSIGRRRRWPI